MASRRLRKCSPSFKAVKKLTTSKARTKRFPKKQWEEMDPIIEEMYLKYNMKETVKMVAERWDPAPNERQIRHRVETVLDIKKYCTPNNPVTDHDSPKRGTKRKPNDDRIILAIQGDQFFQAIGDEKRAYRLLKLRYDQEIAKDGDNRDEKACLRAVIAVSRTASNKEREQEARDALEAHFPGPEDTADTRAKTHILSAIRAYLSSRGNTPGAKEKAPQQAQESLRHFFATTPEPGKPAETDVSCQWALGSQVDLLSVFALSYTLDTAGDDFLPDSLVLEAGTTTENFKDVIIGQLYRQQPALTHGDKTDNTVGDCAKWLHQRFLDNKIHIPDTLEDVDCPNHSDWRDEHELMVAIWQEYVETLRSGQDDGWSAECEATLSISPAELLAVILRCLIKQPVGEEQQPSLMAKQPRAGFRSQRGGLTPNYNSADIPSPSSLRSRSSISSNLNGMDLATPNADCIKRRKDLVSWATDRIRDLVLRKELMSEAIDAFYEMNEVGNFEDGDRKFRAAMHDAVEKWVDQDLLVRCGQSDKAGSSGSAPSSPSQEPSFEMVHNDVDFESDSLQEYTGSEPSPEPSPGYSGDMDVDDEGKGSPYAGDGALDFD